MTDPDRDLLDYLNRRSPLSARYREISDERTPPELDAAVLQQARIAVRTPAARPSRRRWMVPLALAATLVVGVDLVWRLQDLRTPTVAAVTGSTEVAMAPQAAGSSPRDTPMPRSNEFPPPPPAPAPSLPAAAAPGLPVAQVEEDGDRLRVAAAPPVAAAAIAAPEASPLASADEDSGASADAEPPSDIAAAEADASTAAATSADEGELAAAAPMEHEAQSQSQSQSQARAEAEAAARERAQAKTAEDSGRLAASMARSAMAAPHRSIPELSIVKSSLHQAQAAAADLAELLRAGKHDEVKARYQLELTRQALQDAAAIFAEPLHPVFAQDKDGSWRVGYYDEQRNMRCLARLRPLSPSGWRLVELTTRPAK